MTDAPLGIEAQLAVINTKLDLVLATRDDHETRIRGLEQFKWVFMGAAAILGGSAGALTRFIS